MIIYDSSQSTRMTLEQLWSGRPPAPAHTLQLGICKTQNVQTKNVDTTKFAHKTNVHTIKFANNVWAQTNYTHKILTQKLQCKETGLVTPCYCFQPKLGCNTVLVLQPTVQVQTGRKRPKVIASNHRFPKSDAHALK